MALKPQITQDLGELYIDTTVDPTVSSVLKFDSWRGAIQVVIVDGPGALTGTARVQVSHSDEDTDVYGTTWRDLQSGGADILIPADGSVQINTSGFRRMRIASSGSEAADRRFRIRGIESAA